MEAARDLGHLLEHGHEITFGLLEVRDRRPLAVRQTRADLLQVQVKREQVLLSAVVEISLEPTSRGVSSLDDACARGEQSARAVALATAVATSWGELAEPDLRTLGDRIRTPGERDDRSCAA